CHNQVHLAPRATANQTCSEHELTIDPLPSVRSRRHDYFGNFVDCFSIQESHEGLDVTATSLVDVTAPPVRNFADSPAWEDLAGFIPRDLSADGVGVYQFTLASPRLAPSAAVREYALPSFPRRRPIAEVARDLTARIHADFTFDPKATTVHTPPEELLAHKRGVCQDFAQLAIGCIRSLGLAA